jgi:hypothetical protein
LPISLTGFSTSGFSGNLCSRGGNLPDLTILASIGASLAAYKEDEEQIKKIKVAIAFILFIFPLIFMSTKFLFIKEALQMIKNDAFALLQA